MRFIRSNAISLLALFVALGGTSYAVIHLPRGSVGPRELRKNAVSSSKVRDGSLRLADLRSSARRALHGQAGPAGPAGPSGPGGETGPSEVIVKTFGGGEVHANEPALVGDVVTAPPGSYYVRARANIAQADWGAGQAEFLLCRIDTPATSGQVIHRFWLNNRNAVGQNMEVFADRVVTLTAADPTVVFRCPGNVQYPASFSYSDAEIVLQRVGKITQLP